MNPLERAKEIRDWFYSDTPEEGDLGFIENHIQQAVEEANRNDLVSQFSRRLEQISGLELDEARKQAKREAYQEAAKVAEEYITEEYRTYEWVKDIVADIRALKEKL